MVIFPESLYSDVRIEDIFSTTIRYTHGDLEEMKIQTYKAAFIRVYDGRRWYYSAISNPEFIQTELDSLACLASHDPDINGNSAVRKFQINTGSHLKFEENPVSDIEEDRKIELLESYFPVLAESRKLKTWTGVYIDRLTVKHFLSSRGADITFDSQAASIAFGFRLASGENRLSESFHRAATSFDGLTGHHDSFAGKLARSEEFVDNSVPVKPGEYNVILSPFASGIFAHESFGHKSEADFMMGDETMMKEWSIGSCVGSDILSIVDDGNEPGTGYVPFDDEGTRAVKTFLVRNGILSGRLHSASTAANMDEDVTGNARSVSFEFEPIPRMTTTYIERGSKTKEELFNEVEKGLYVDTIIHGSGLSTFTLAPSMSWMIRDGKISEPVSVSVISGNVMKTLNRIDGLSDRLELFSIPGGGGCGKMEQSSLPVGFGGPYMRVREMNVQ